MRIKPYSRYKPRFKKNEKPISWKIKLLWFSPIIIIAIIVKFPEWKQSFLLSQYGKETTGKVLIASTKGIRGFFDTDNILYNFVYNNEVIQAYAIASTNNNNAFTPFGMPIKGGHGFKITYYPKNPHINKIHFDYPDGNTLLDYLYTISDKIKELDLITTEKNNYNKRLEIALKIFKQFGINGWANIMFHDEYIIENFSNNAYTYKRMIKSEEFKAIINEN